MSIYRWMEGGARKEHGDNSPSGKLHTAEYISCKISESYPRSDAVAQSALVANNSNDRVCSQSQIQFYPPTKHNARHIVSAPLLSVE